MRLQVQLPHLTLLSHTHVILKVCVGNASEPTKGFEGRSFEVAG